MKKMTYVEALTAYIEDKPTAEALERITELRAQMQKKSSKSGEKKVNEVMEAAKEKALAYLATVEMASVRDVMDAIGTEKDRFATAVLTSLREHDKENGVDNGPVTKKMVKGKSMYYLK